ncbi:MAG: macro domain-containing protein [Candidatus Omnitrophica bacterium]|nr:macro domain-containing protein [Candidatus Omnitrophota bacterium]
MVIVRQGVTVECAQGDIARQNDCRAVVNAANAALLPGGGVAGALHRAAGPELNKACRLLAPIKPGDAVLTKGYNLPNTYVIHCLGPVYGRDNPSDVRLADCYRNALLLAEQHLIESIAFPAISAGIFGYPMEAAARVAFTAIFELLPQLHHVKLIRFVLFTEEYRRIHEKVLKEVNEKL